MFAAKRFYALRLALNMFKFLRVLFVAGCATGGILHGHNQSSFYEKYRQDGRIQNV